MVVTAFTFRCFAETKTGPCWPKATLYSIAVSFHTPTGFLLQGQRAGSQVDLVPVLVDDPGDRSEHHAVPRSRVVAPGVDRRRQRPAQEAALKVPRRLDDLECLDGRDAVL